MPGKWIENLIVGLRQLFKGSQQSQQAYQQVDDHSEQALNNAQNDKPVTNDAGQMFFHRQLHKLDALQEVERCYQQLQPNKDS